MSAETAYRSGRLRQVAFMDWETLAADMSRSSGTVQVPAEPPAAHAHGRLGRAEPPGRELGPPHGPGLPGRRARPRRQDTKASAKRTTYSST